MPILIERRYLKYAIAPPPPFYKMIWAKIKIGKEIFEGRARKKQETRQTDRQTDLLFQILLGEADLDGHLVLLVEDAAEELGDQPDDPVVDQNLVEP